MPPVTPQLLISTATALASWEHQRNPVNAGDDRASIDLKRRDASLRFVYFAGFWSRFAHDICCSSWPLPRTEHIEELIKFAKERRGVASSPAAGDIFLLASARADRHILAGIVAAVETARTMLNGSQDFVCITIEGELGAAQVGEAAARVATARLVRRRLSRSFGDCFIRWCDLAAQASPAAVEYRAPAILFTLDRARGQKAA